MAGYVFYFLSFSFPTADPLCVSQPASRAVSSTLSTPLADFQPPFLRSVVCVAAAQ